MSGSCQIRKSQLSNVDRAGSTSRGEGGLVRCLRRAQSTRMHAEKKHHFDPTGCWCDVLKLAYYNVPSFFRLDRKVIGNTTIKGEP